MEYNFINWMFWIGLLGGGIPFASLFADGKHLKLQKILLNFQMVCFGFGAFNLIYGIIKLID